MFYVSALSSNKFTVFDKGKKRWPWVWCLNGLKHDVALHWVLHHRVQALVPLSCHWLWRRSIKVSVRHGTYCKLACLIYSYIVTWWFIHTWYRCYRILGLIMLVSGLVATFMFRERGENKARKTATATKERPKLGEIFQLDLLKTPTFLLWCLTDIFMEGAYYVPFFYLPCKTIVLC